MVLRKMGKKADYRSSIIRVERITDALNSRFPNDPQLGRVFDLQV